MKEFLSQTLVMVLIIWAACLFGHYVPVLLHMTLGR
jgi:hypothetical protein